MWIKFSKIEIKILKIIQRRDKERPLVLEKAILNIRKDLFSDGKGGIFLNKYNKWCNKQLRKLNKAVVELLSFLHNENFVESATFFGCYLDGHQRGFRLFYKSNIKIHVRPAEFFNKTETGLFHVLNNICKNKQAEVKSSRPHNVLTKQDIMTLYDSDSLSMKTPLGFLPRMIFNIALETT